jgi:hypothetical protein
MRSRVIYHNNGTQTFEVEGREVSEDEYRARTGSNLQSLFTGGPPMIGNTPSCWPMESEALAIHPSQIKEATERNKRNGITGVSYAPDGTAILADRGARRDLMRLEGLHDRNGGYGDDHATSSPQDPMKDTAGPLLDLDNIPDAAEVGEKANG